MSSDRSLAEVLANRMSSGQAIPVPLTLAIVRQVCDALDYAHGLRDQAGQWLGIVHKDVSPGNIWLSEAGRATLVASSAAQGNFAYMAPEYVMTGTLDWRADLFAVGVVTYEMLTNRPLFAAGTDRETLDRVCTFNVPPPSTINPNLPPELDGIVLTALGRDPAQRWQYAAMLRDQLSGVAQHYGLDVASMNPMLWLDLLTPRLEPPAPTAPPPPSDPRVWAEAIDDGDSATRIEPMDPAMLVAVRSPTSADPTPLPSPMEPPASRKQAASTPAPVAVVEPEAAPEEPLVDRDLGPEPTHIGAMPLISFGDTPLVSKVGENPRPAPRPSGTTLAPPVGTFLREPTAPGMPRTKRIVIGVGIAVAVAAIVIAVVLLTG